jgi:hypothetical protein
LTRVLLARCDEAKVKKHQILNYLCFLTVTGDEESSEESSLYEGTEFLEFPTSLEDFHYNPLEFVGASSS